MSLILFVLAVVVIVLVALLPVKIAAHVVGARNPAFGACFAAVVVAVVINLVAAHFFRYGGVVSVLLTAIAYMWLLETTYLKGVLIALLQIVIAWVLKIVLIALGFVTLVHVIGPMVGPMSGRGHWV